MYDYLNCFKIVTLHTSLSSRSLREQGTLVLLITYHQTAFPRTAPWCTACEVLRRRTASHRVVRRQECSSAYSASVEVAGILRRLPWLIQDHQDHQTHLEHLGTSRRQDRQNYLEHLERLNGLREHRRGGLA